METVHHLEDFIKYLTAIGRAEATCKFYREFVGLFFRACEKSVFQVQTEDVISYLSRQEKSERTRYARYIALKRFFTWMRDEGKLLSNVMDRVPKPRQYSLLPTRVMTQGEAEKVLNIWKADPSDPLSFRNRTMLELMYSASLRRGELVRLEVKDYEPSLRSLRVHQGKTRTVKIVPVGRIAAEMLEYYLKEIRPNGESSVLFLSTYLKPLRPCFVTTLVYRARKKAKIRTKASAHSFRKTSCSLSMKNGCRIEVAQKLMGHNSILSTTAYAKFYPVQLEKALRANHPRERQKNIVLPELQIPPWLTKRIPFKIQNTEPESQALLIQEIHRHHPRLAEDEPLPKLKLFDFR